MTEKRLQTWQQVGCLASGLLHRNVNIGYTVLWQGTIHYVINYFIRCFLLLFYYYFLHHVGLDLVRCNMSHFHCRHRQFIFFFFIISSDLRTTRLFTKSMPFPSRKLFSAYLQCSRCHPPHPTALCRLSFVSHFSHTHTHTSSPTTPTNGCVSFAIHIK